MKTIRALGINYWKYWTASTVSMAASNILQYVLSLYVLDVTGSAVVFAGMLSIILFPRLLLTPLAGVSADRYRRTRIMALVLLCEVLILGIYGVISKTVDLPLVAIFALVVALEMGEVFYGASENAIIPDLVEAEHLKSAIAISKADDGIVFVISPMVGALIYSNWNLGICFLTVAGLNLLGAILLCITKTREHQKNAEEKKGVLGEFMEGVKIIRGDAFLRRYILSLPLIDACFGATFSVSVCYLLRLVYRLNAYEYGLYNSVTASMSIWVPIVIVPLVSKWKADHIYKNATRLIALELALIGILALLGIQGILPIPVSVVAITVLDCLTIIEAMPMQMAGSIMIQTKVESGFLGRVTSTLGMIISVAVAAGEFCFGFLNDSVGVCPAIFIGAVGVGIGSWIYSSGCKQE
ncbi:MAG: MFS transporter [Lachnospiraceae bacterium]|nr:MFS transporter [Lachnospiraceae bacterium]